MTKHKRFLFWAAGCGAYASFMIGYSLVLTLLLPSILAYEPECVKVGSYAEYYVEQYSNFALNDNGTYAWSVISVHTDVNGQVIATINETYTVWWKRGQWASFPDIPSTGRISDVNVKNGFPRFWFDRYYNDYLIGLTVFRIGNYTFCGQGLEEVSIDGVTRPSVKLTDYSAQGWWFDRETGLLLRYSSSFRGYGSYRVLEGTNIADGTGNNKAMVDLLLVSPLFVVPSVGAATGLFLIKRRRRQFSSQFWLYFVLFNGIIMVSVANFPFGALLSILCLGFSYAYFLVIYLVMLKALFWFGVLAAAIFLIDRFAFPLIQRRPEQLLPSTTPGEFRTKDTSLTAVLALIAGVFGLWGIGHIYVEKKGKGIALLILSIVLIWNPLLSPGGFDLGFYWLSGWLIYVTAIIGGQFFNVYFSSFPGVLSLCMVIIRSIVIPIVFILQTYDAYKLAKHYNRDVQQYKKAPW